jgi:hypothetical protein
MVQYVITVGRQFGSLGRPVALKAAELLDINCYDRDVVEEVSKRMNLPLKVVSRKEEDASAEFGKFGKMLYPAGYGDRQLQNHIFSVQECVIRDFADRESCIVVGRCADYILRDHPNLMTVFIYAPLEMRVKNCVGSLSMQENEARKMCAGVDKARLAYHREFTGYDPMDPEHFDLMLNSAMLGVDGTAEMLAAIVKKRFAPRAPEWPIKF